MANQKPPPHPVVRNCPVCHFPQTRIQRKLAADKHGTMNYVCSRVECAIGIDLKKVDTWIVV